MIHLRLVPELRLIESPAEQRRVYESALSALYRRPSFWVAFLIGTVALACGIGVFFLLLRPYLRVRRTAVVAITSVIVSGSILFIARYVLRRPLRTLVRTQLVEMGIPVCIHCGYDLRGQQEPRCPECGQPAPGITLAENRKHR